MSGRLVCWAGICRLGWENGRGRTTLDDDGGACQLKYKGGKSHHHAGSQQKFRRREKKVGKEPGVASSALACACQLISLMPAISSMQRDSAFHV